jgi:antitoxin component YwqK of YwqJK toxin-antitoxin module
VVDQAPRLIRRAFGVLALAAVAGAAAQDYAIEGGCREGRPHGAYELRDGDGRVRVVGAFALGKRTGSFLYWSSAGVRIAQLPFEDDMLSGTLALWYATADRTGEGRRKLEAVYVAGRLHGVKRSWYPDGRPRSEFRYDKGTLVDARAFSEAGTALSAADARARAASDLAEDERYYATLNDIVLSHRPRCAPASDRLERS